MPRKASETASSMTMFLALEQLFPKDMRVLEDDLACHCLSWRYKALVRMLGLLKLRALVFKWLEIRCPGLWANIVFRKRFIDDKLGVAVKEGCSALINLGAGFDTRAYRLPEVSQIPIWELDQPGNITTKRFRLQKALGEMPANLKLVPADLEHQNLGEVLASHGYTSGDAVFFIWEGVSQYLSKAGFNNVWRFLAKAPSGSRLAFTYISKDLIEGTAIKGLEAFHREWILEKKIWRLGLDPQKMDALFGCYGWRIREHFNFTEILEHCAKPAGRRFKTFEHAWMVYAQKA